MPVSGDIITDFVAAMREHGLEPAEEIVADGELHRVGWRRDKPGTRNGAYVLHLNGHPAGFVECFRRGIRFTWSPRARASARPSAERSPRRSPRSGSAAGERNASGTGCSRSRRKRHLKPVRTPTATTPI
jgi:putative DNA primase/helicase